MEVAKGKWPEISLLQRGEGSGSGKGLVVTSKGAIDKEAVESYNSSDQCAMHVKR